MLRPFPSPIPLTERPIMPEHVKHISYKLAEDTSLTIALSDGSSILLDPMATYALAAFLYANVSREVFPMLPTTDDLAAIVEAMDEKEKGDHNEH